MGIINEMSRRRKISELIDAWIEYRDMVTRHAAQGTATPEQERQFLNLKARISAQLPLMDQITGPGNLHAEAATHMRGMTDLMNTQLTLVGNGSSTAAAGDDFLGRWHSHFLYLNRFKGQDQRAPMAARRAAATAPVSGRSGPGINRMHHFFNNWFTRLIVQLAVLAAIVLVATRVFNIDWTQAPEWGRRVAAEWWGPSPTRPAGEAANRVRGAAAQHDAATSRAVGQASGTGQTQTTPPRGSGNTIQINGPANRPMHSVDNSGRFIPPIGPNPVRTFADKVAPIIPRPVREFFRPVSQYWGVEMTVALVGIGLLLFAYMIFGRAR